MSEQKSITVHATDISKNYQIFAKPKYWLADFLGMGRLLKEGKHYRSFWALRDIDLTIPTGSRVALIGRNGAGKSTLLRIISGNIMPTTGSIRTRGHVEALLELGSGFNPNFSGRENVYTALAYKGLTGRAADEKYFDIADFSELDEFLDQPFHTYSSGMRLRLAFATATAIVPETLIIDEILAAGDMYFQSKCIARIDELTSEPETTFLFVSHDLDAAQRLCDTFIWIDRGRIMASGPAAEVRVLYEESVRKQQEIRMRARNLRLSKQTVSALQTAGEDGGHILGRFVVGGDKPGDKGPFISNIRLLINDEQEEEILVGHAMDDAAPNYPSFVITDQDGSTWGTAKKSRTGYGRPIQAGKNGAHGAGFALFLAHSDFSHQDPRVEIEVVYRDDAAHPCKLELIANPAGPIHLGDFAGKKDGAWKTFRVLVPRWIYAASQKRQLDEDSVTANDSRDKTPSEAGLFFGTKRVIIEKMEFLDQQGNPTFCFQHGAPMTILLYYKAEDDSLVDTPLVWSLTLQRTDGVNAAQVISPIHGASFVVEPRGCLRMHFAHMPLAKGHYWIYTAIWSKLDLQGYAAHFTRNEHLFDMRRKCHQIRVEGTYPMENCVFRPKVQLTSHSVTT